MKDFPPAAWIVMTLLFGAIHPQASQGQTKAPAKAPMLERIKFVVPFAKEGEVTVERSSRAVRPGTYVSEELIPDGSAIRTGEGGSVSLMLGESAESGTLRLGAGCEVRLPEIVSPASGKAGSKTKAKARARGGAVRSATDEEDEQGDMPSGAAKHSLQLNTGSVVLNAQAGRLTDSGVGFLHRRHGTAEVVVLTPYAWVAAQAAQLFCSVSEGVETVGVLKGTSTLRAMAMDGGGLELKEGQAVEFRDGRWGDVRAITDEERTREGEKLRQAMLISVPLDVFVQGSTVKKNLAPTLQGWSRELKAPETSWSERKPLLSSFDLWSDNSKLSDEGAILTQLPLHRWQTFFRYETHVREGDAVSTAPPGGTTRTEIPQSSVKALVFQMRVLNASRLVYHVGEAFHTPEHVLYLPESAQGWEEYHLPLTDASSQGTNKSREGRNGLSGLYLRFDPYQAKPQPPVDQIVFEMRDFRALVLP